ncbi:MAG TPA: hypothetical protein VHX20_19330 [Terracidiphilus sp.]|jgi:hypothetical protein|nr:hypothetical protein [Terracidiphilus sp.]
MTTNQLQRKMARIVRDIDAVSEELFDRCCEEELNRMTEAETKIGQVCMVFLDAKQLEPLDSISAVFRRWPGSTTDENFTTVGDRYDLAGKMTKLKPVSIKTAKKTPVKRKQAA